MSALFRKLSNELRRQLGLGESNELRRQRKAVKRKERFESPLWRRDLELAQRNYDSYDDYVSHQSSKLAHVHHRRIEAGKEDPAEFIRRFSDCEPLPEARSVLCLGARLG